MSDELFFPENLCALIGEILKKRLVDHDVFLRPLRGNDPALSIGVYPSSWNPSEDAMVIGQMEPVLSRYAIKVQNMVKDGDQEAGQMRFSVLAKTVRAILYRDPELRVRLPGLSEEAFGSVERVKRYGVLRQDFQRDQGTRYGFVFLATTDLYVDTENTEL